MLLTLVRMGGVPPQSWEMGFARVISIWLSNWKTDRLERPARGGVKLREPLPLAVIAKGKGGKRLLALNAGARAAGLRTGMLLTDACVMLPSLATAPHDSQAERLELKRLAASCNRFSPWTGPDEPDGLWIEATGLAHLFGGEEALLRHIVRYLHGLGFTARCNGGNARRDLPNFHPLSFRR